MSVIAENNVNINANIDDIFTYISNMENFGEWFPEVIAIKSENSGNYAGAGKKYLDIITFAEPCDNCNENNIYFKAASFNNLASSRLWVVETKLL